MRLNVHFHTLALDGVYVRDEDGQLQFCALGAPTAEEVAQVAAWTHAALVRVLERHRRSLGGISDAPDTFADEPVLASCYGASGADLQLLGAAAGQKTAKLAHPLRLVSPPGAGALAQVGGTFTPRSRSTAVTELASSASAAKSLDHRSRSTASSSTLMAACGCGSRGRGRTARTPCRSTSSVGCVR